MEIQGKKNFKKMFFPQTFLSICLRMNVNASSMKQEYVFRHDKDMLEAKVYFRPQDSMT
jgi:hypothetical protein